MSPLAPIQAALVAALTLATSVGPGESGEPPRGSFALRCGALHVGDGTVLNDCWLIVKDGKVERIAAGSASPGELPVVDASSKVVMPGLVAADSDLSGHGDDPYTVTPDFVALDGFDFLREYRQALAGGVTTVYLAPGRNRLVPGQGSVVKLAGDDIVARVVAENACLRVTLGEAANQNPALFEPTVHPTSDDPLLPARRQYPSARISQLDTLRGLFADAARIEGDVLVGPGSVEDRYDPTALRHVVAGELPLRIAAQEAADIRRALQFAKELGVAGAVVLEDPWQIAPVAKDAASAGATAVFRVPVALSSANPGGENRKDERVRPVPEAPGQAHAAGMTVALAPARSGDLADMLMVAGLAVRFGLPESAALAGVTSAAARALGVADRVGALTPGKDADFVVLSGAPLATGTLVEQTWIDGRRVYVRETESNVLAVKAARVLTGDGGVIENGVILVQDGRIKGVGTDLALPYGAEVIDLSQSGAVMVPGFIDGWSSLGLSGDGTGVPPGAPNQKIADVVRPDDPVLQHALRAGVTTVLTSGTDSGLNSGRIAAIKTGASDHASMVVSDIAGLRIVFDAVGDDAVKPIRDQIEKARKYVEDWRKYDEAVAAFEAGKAAKPVEAKPAEEPAEATDPISGTWECAIEVPPMNLTLELTLRLELKGKDVSGTALARIRDRELPEQPVSGTFENGTLKMTVRFMRNESQLEAKIDGDKLTGTVNAMGQDVPITGARVSKSAKAAPAKSAAKADDGAPKKPNVDESLEPWRRAIAGDATVVVRTDKAPAIRAVVELFTKEKIPFALQSVDDAIDTPAILGSEAPPILLGPDLVRREDGELVNQPARLVDAGAKVAIVTGDTAGSRYLPLHAAHAIRYGLDPNAALSALTIEPARAFRIDDRVGSLVRGKDADFVVFDGSPFEITSRPLLVVCNGRVVHDARPTTKEGQ